MPAWAWVLAIWFGAGVVGGIALGHFIWVGQGGKGGLFRGR